MSGRNIEESRIKVDNFIIRLCAKECCSSCRPLLSIDAIQIAQMRMKISLRPANGTHPCLPDHPSHGCVHVDIHCKSSTRMQYTNIYTRRMQVLFYDQKKMNTRFLAWHWLELPETPSLFFILWTYKYSYSSQWDCCKLPFVKSLIKTLKFIKLINIYFTNSAS